MAVRIQLRRDTAANWTSNNPTLREGEIGIETDTLKMKVGTGSHTWTQITNYANVVPTNLNTTLNGYVEVGDIGAESGVAGLNGLQNLLIPNDSIIFEGATEDGFETTLTVEDPTADRTITFPNATGTVALAENVAALSGATFTGNISVPTQITFEGATANDFETIISVTDPTSDRVITLPDLTGTVVLRDTVETITNKSISLGSNTVTSTLAQLNTAVSDADLASLAGTETLTNKTLTSPVINTPTGITKSDVGLANVDNTTDANKPISTATQTALDLKAPLANPTFTGTVTLPANTISQSMMSDDSVGTNEIGGLAVTEGKLADGAVTNAKVSASAAIAQSKIADLTTDLAAKAPLAAPAFTGTATAVNLTLSGDLIVNGTTTTLNSTTMSVDDKNIELGSVATPSDATADGGGITLKGTTDKTFNWVDATDAWTSSEHLNLASGKSLYLNGTLLKDATETLTNKTLTTPIINGPTITDTGQTPTIHGIYLPAPHTIIFEGTTANDFETTLTAGEPTADNTVTLPNASGTLQLRVADVSDTEIGYLNGVTSDIQTQLNNKQAVVANVSDTEIGYLDGVTSAIQTQLDGKVDESLFDTKGDILVASADNTPTKLAAGTNGYLLTANSSATNGIEWAAAPVSLPSQTGNSGEYLTTDGSTASWAAIPVTSAATATTLGTVYGAMSNSTTNTSLGYNASATGGNSIAIGVLSDVSAADAVAVGRETYTAAARTTVVGSIASTRDADSTAIGYDAQTGESSNVATGATAIGAESRAGRAGSIAIGKSATSYTAKQIVIGAAAGQPTEITRFTIPGMGLDFGKAATLTANTATTIDTMALSSFTSAEYLISLKQGSKVRTSKVIVQDDGTNVDMTEFAITETGGTMTGVVVSASVSSTDAILQVTVTDAATTNVTVKFNKVTL